MKKLLLLPLFLLSINVSLAKVSKVEITTREVVLGGKAFGQYGAYEYIKGRLYFVTDPANPFNTRVTDISLAPVNADGLVLSSTSFEVLQPVDPLKRRGIALVEVSNRGGKFSLRYFNRSRNSQVETDSQASFGDDLLMRQGLTIIWLGWQFDVPEGDNILKLEVPSLAGRAGIDLAGLVRSDWVVDEPTNILSLGHRSQQGYPAMSNDDIRNQLTVRDGRESQRRVVERDEWSFAKDSGGSVVPDQYHIYSQKGFEEGKIYELVYVSNKPAVTGLGLTAIRDIISFARYDSTCPFPVKTGFAAGVSQTGRFLRHFLYQGFNTDEEGRKAYDGMMIITAGAGRGSFNHRYAQPSRDAHGYSAFFYPTDIFPFTSLVYTDDLTLSSDGILSHMWNENHIPRLMQINTGYEYWGRAAALIHVDPSALSDVRLHTSERIYHLASGQHYVGPEPGESNKMPSGPGYRTDPLDYSVNYRSLLVSLVNWVESGTEPPKSNYPLISNGTLVAPQSLNYPTISEFTFNYTPHVAYRADYGPRWPQGIIDYEPPVINQPFLTLVPQVDSFGNEIGGVRNIEIRVPVATYFPWNLREGYAGGRNAQTDFTGTFVPLVRKSRIDNNGSRPSLEMLYSSKADYLIKVNKEIEKLIEEGFVLREDAGYLRKKAVDRWMKWAESTN